MIQCVMNMLPALTQTVASFVPVTLDSQEMDIIVPVSLTMCDAVCCSLIFECYVHFRH